MSVDLVKYKFDNKTFNQDFAKYIDEQSESAKLIDEQKLARLNVTEREKQLSEMTTGEMKKYTTDKINECLKEHQKKRKEAKKKVEEFLMRV